MISLDHFYRRGMSEPELLSLKTKIESEMDNVKQVDSINQPGLSTHFTIQSMEQLEQKHRSIMYALWRINPTLYSTGEPDPSTFRILFA